jgi:hypothetical protein
VAARLKRLRKNAGLGFLSEGRGFSRAVSLALSTATLVAEGRNLYYRDFFRSHFEAAPFQSGSHHQWFRLRNQLLLSRHLKPHLRALQRVEGAWIVHTRIAAIELGFSAF